MLLNQIILYFMTGGTEEEVKEEIKRKIKCGVEIEEVGQEEPHTLVIESANSSVVDTSEVEILTKQGVETETELEEETPGLESISQDENVISRNLTKPENENTVEVFEKETGNGNMVASDEHPDKKTTENGDKTEEQTDGNVTMEENRGHDNLTTENDIAVNTTAKEEAKGNLAADEEVDENLPRKGETREDSAREEQTAVSDEMSAEVRQQDNICNPVNAEDLEQQHCNEGENSSKQIAEIPEAEVDEVADEVNDDQSVISYLDEDETLIQEVEKSDMVEEAQPWATGGTEVKVDVDEVRMTSSWVTEDPGQGEGLSQRRDEAGGNVNDTRENATPGYVSIVDRMLGMSAKPSQKYEAEEDNEPKEVSGKRDQNQHQKEEKNDVSIIVETIKSATNQTEAKEVEVELSPQQVSVIKVIFADQLKFSYQPSSYLQRQYRPNQVGLKVAMDRVLREKSAAKEMSVPRYFYSSAIC